MKLVRFGPPNQERPGVLMENESKILDVRAMAFDIEDFNSHFFTHWGLQRLQALLKEPVLKTVPAAGVRLGPPVDRPGKIVCLGKNYADHALEFDSEIPASPILFSKASSSLAGPFDPILLPRDAKVVDGEVELAVVIGRTAQRVSESDAMQFVAGYTVLNDITDRKAQKEGKQWFRAKSADTFCPLGPCLVTTDEIPNPQNLRLYSKVNGQTLQDSNTSKMIFKIAYLISFISASITLEPGDVIATGTPGGIGSAHKPPILLKPGDVVETSVEGVGAQRGKVESL
jgi:2-keto-4-pentenoate hydratase/2-oxohepta-3-ene-1,7-dioic acid hydratase in catechol pathway